MDGKNVATEAGKAIMGCGCLIMLLPIAAVLLFVLMGIASSVP